MSNPYEGIRFTYFRDPLLPRVVTVATRWTEKKGELQIGFCANNVDPCIPDAWFGEREQYYERKDGRFMLAHRVLDTFNKKTAREISSSRLKKKPRTIQVPEHQSRIQALVDYFLNSGKTPDKDDYVPNQIRTTVRRARQEVMGVNVASPDLTGRPKTR